MDNLPNFTTILFETTETLGFFEEYHPNKNNNNKNKMSSDMGSVPGPKMHNTALNLK